MSSLPSMPPHTSVTYPLAPEELENLRDSREKRKKEGFSNKGINTSQKRRTTGRTLPAHIFMILSTHTSTSTVHPLAPKKHFQVWNSELGNGTPVPFQHLVLPGFTVPVTMTQPPSPKPTPGPPPVPTGEVRCLCHQAPEPPDSHLLNDGFISINHNVLCTDTEKNELLLRKPH